MNRRLQVKLAAAGAILVVVLVAIYFRLSSDIDDGQRVTDSGGSAEKPRERARDILRKDADLASCRLALQQVNAHLTDPDTKKQPPPLSASEREDLRGKLGLDEGELAEVENPSFTLLDAHHLELCLLLRDAVRAMELRSRSDHVAPQVEAAAAFAWVVRQVRLNTTEADVAKERVMGPEMVLRRGFGSPLARALLFLGVLDQLGHDKERRTIDGCLLALPGGRPEAPRYWACGVLGEKGQIYLFDPRLGIPLPGPGGKGIATLAEAGGKDSPLRQLDFGGDQRYDVTPEQAAASEVHLAPPLSALAPRMEFLEKELLAPGVPVRLAASPAAAERFSKALKASGHRTSVVKRVAWAARLQRLFLPKAEGGGDTARQRDLALRELTDPYLPLLRDALTGDARPKDLIDFTVDPINQIVEPYMRQVTDLLLTPGQPRDLLLHGQYVEAESTLGLAEQRTQVLKQEYEKRFKGSNPQGPKAIEEWYNAASRAAARRNTEEVAELWQKYAGPLGVLIGGAGAARRLAEIVYLQGLCKQERAERLQFRLEHFPGVVTDREINQAHNLWREMAKLWEDYIDKHGAALPAQRFRARAQEKLADVLALRASRRPAAERPGLEENARRGWRQAADRWGDLAAQTTDLQALAYRYQAKRLEEKLAGKD